MFSLKHVAGPSLRGAGLTDNWGALWPCTSQTTARKARIRPHAVACAWGQPLLLSPRHMPAAQPEPSALAQPTGSEEGGGGRGKRGALGLENWAWLENAGGGGRASPQALGARGERLLKEPTTGSVARWLEPGPAPSGSQAQLPAEGMCLVAKSIPGPPGQGTLGRQPIAVSLSASLPLPSTR